MSMIAILSLLIGGLVNVLPLILNLFGKYMDVKKEIKISELEYELAKANVQKELDLANIIERMREGESLRSHDASLTGSGFVNGLRRSVRPVITYMFFALFMVVKGVGIYHVVWVGGISLNEALPLLWDESTQAIFGGICGFWFGSRAIEKYWGNKFKA